MRNIPSFIRVSSVRFAYRAEHVLECMVLRWFEFETPIGQMFSLEQTGIVRRVSFRKDAVLTADASNGGKRCVASEAIKEYFDTGLTPDDLLLDRGALTRFQREVSLTLECLSTSGEVISYSNLAAVAGYPKACRAVGTALRHNRFPILIPCHRVIRLDGSLGQYIGGSQIKSKLIDFEAGRLSLDLGSDIR